MDSVLIQVSQKLVHQRNFYWAGKSEETGGDKKNQDALKEPGSILFSKYFFL